ncbi:MAG: hypothetical protein JWO86_8291 [Myxococcaceae bacterium]|jgi:alcohol dehydrogenase class IV|nr:hypothetical protein [Myxococcaceae bacterium]
MDTKTITNDVKNEVTKGIEKLNTLRDEVKLHIHLASLDAKQEWNDKLEPKINEIANTAHNATDASKAAIHDLVTKVEGFYAKLRGNNTPAS